MQPRPIERLQAEVHEVVERRGFSLSAPRAEWTGKWHILSWVRRTWKEDLVRLGWRTRTSSEYFLDAQWSVPRQDRQLVAAGIDPGYLRRGVQWQSWPRLWPLIGELIERRWRGEVLRDLEFALSWFERCASAAGAMEELRNPARNGPRPGTDAYAYIENYIRITLPASGPPAK